MPKLLVPDNLAYRPFQAEGIREIMANPQHLLADEMGLGKTIQAIGVINNMPVQRVLIICPPSLKYNWAGELRTWLSRPMRIGIVGDKFDKTQTDNGTLIAIVAYNAAHNYLEQLRRRPWDLLVADEAHNMQNPKSRRTRAVLGNRARKFPKWSSIPADRTLFMTGTPMRNRPENLWPLLTVLDPSGLGRNYWQYVRRYCSAHMGKWGFNTKGASHQDELHRRMKPFTTRRLKAEVLPELPPKRHQIIPMTTTRQMDKLIRKEREAHKNFKDYIKSLGGKPAKRKLMEMDELSRLRRDVALAKVPQVLDLVKEGLEEGPVVLFAYHTEVIEVLTKDRDHLLVTGSTPHKKRQQAVDAFRDGKCDLFIGQIEAAGEGFTLTRSAHVIFAEIDWTPGVISQAEDRCHRIGQMESLLVQFPVLKGSLDEDMLRLIYKKQKNITRIIDGR